MTTCLYRSGLGSTPECLPKKLSSSTAVSEVCASVLPTIPNLNGLTPSCCSSLRPFFSAWREYSYWSMPGCLGTSIRLPLSQVS